MDNIDALFQNIDDECLIEINGGLAAEAVIGIVGGIITIVGQVASAIDIPNKLRTTGYNDGYYEGQKVAIEIYKNTIEHQKKSAWYQAYYS